MAAAVTSAQVLTDGLGGTGGPGHSDKDAHLPPTQADMLENGGPGESDDPTQKLLGNVLTPSYGINT